jgi:ACS family hexuronate transporter-like MFS transporter
MKDLTNGAELAKPLPMRWVMVGLAFLATVLNYVHRLSFNYLSADGPLRELIPDDAFGYLGTAFFIAYMVSNAFSGFVIDKLGTRLGYSLCMAFWTTAGLIHAFAITPLQFGICRFLLGIGEAGNWPAAVRMTSEWFPPHERSTASGIFNSGAALGAIIVPPLVAFLGLRYGWQSTFIILAAFGYLWLAIFWFVYYTPGSSAQAAKKKIIPPLRLLKTRFVLTFTLSRVFTDSVWYFVTFWMGRYLADVHGWNLKQIGWYAIIPFVIADVGNIIGGYCTQFIIQKGVPIPKARKWSVAISGCMRGIAAGAIHHHDTHVSAYRIWAFGIWFHFMQCKLIDFPRRCCTPEFNGVGMGNRLCWCRTGRRTVPVTFRTNSESRVGNDGLCNSLRLPFYRIRTGGVDWCYDRTIRDGTAA